MTDTVDTEGRWLVEGPGPGASDEAAVAWEVFRTLALWNADVWVPAMLDRACGEGTELAAVDWGPGSVTPMGPELRFEGITALAVECPQAVVVVAATLRPHVTEEELREGMLAALEASMAGGRLAAMIVASPDHTTGLARLDRAGEWELANGQPLGDEIDALGWTSWSDLLGLAIDLAEEADGGRADAVRRTVADLQATAPGLVV